MAYYRNGSRRGGGASLKPPAELVNEQVGGLRKMLWAAEVLVRSGGSSVSMFRAEPWTSRYLRR